MNIKVNDFKLKYKNLILKYNNNEEILHYSIIKNYADILINELFVIEYIEGFFYIPGIITDCPIYLIRKIPNNCTKYEFHIFIDEYIKKAEIYSKSENYSMDNFYIKIS